MIVFSDDNAPVPKFDNESKKKHTGIISAEIFNKEEGAEPI